MRSARISRTTTETDIQCQLNLDTEDMTSHIQSGIGFLDHMLTLLARHGGMQLDITCKGDTDVDDHHSVEDIGIVLGCALQKALGDKKGIKRFGDIALPMDEALVMVAVDISGRGNCYYSLPFETEKIGTFDTQLVQEFLNAFAQNAGITLHVRKLAGWNSHHLAEACFKGLGRVLRQAVERDERFGELVPSTKGTLTKGG